MWSDSDTIEGDLEKRPDCNSIVLSHRLVQISDRALNRTTQNRVFRIPVVGRWSASGLGETIYARPALLCRTPRIPIDELCRPGPYFLAECDRHREQLRGVEEHLVSVDACASLNDGARGWDFRRRKKHAHE